MQDPHEMGKMVLLVDCSPNTNWVGKISSFSFFSFLLAN